MLGLGEGYFTFTVENDMRYKVMSRGGYRSGPSAVGIWEYAWSVREQR